MLHVTVGPLIVATAAAFSVTVLFGSFTEAWAEQATMLDAGGVVAKVILMFTAIFPVNVDWLQSIGAEANKRMLSGKSLETFIVNPPFGRFSR